MSKKEIPSFGGDEEKMADWLFEHRDELDDYFTPPAEQSPIPLHIQLGLPPRKISKAISIRLEEETIEQAKMLASHYKTGYQTLLKQVIKHGLEELEKERSA